MALNEFNSLMAKVMRPETPKRTARVVNRTYASGRLYWTVECDECLVVLNSGHHYNARTLAQRDADEHNAREHAEVSA